MISKKVLKNESFFRKNLVDSKKFRTFALQNEIININ
jgi:hypothetical protein